MYFKNVFAVLILIPSFIVTDIKEVSHNIRVKPRERKIMQDPDLNHNVIKKSPSVTDIIDIIFNDWISEWRKKSIKYTILIYLYT